MSATTARPPMRCPGTKLSPTPYFASEYVSAYAPTGESWRDLAYETWDQIEELHMEDDAGNCETCTTIDREMEWPCSTVELIQAIKRSGS